MDEEDRSSRGILGLRNGVNSLDFANAVAYMEENRWAVLTRANMGMNWKDLGRDFSVGPRTLISFFYSSVEYITSIFNPLVFWDVYILLYNSFQGLENVKKTFVVL